MTQHSSLVLSVGPQGMELGFGSAGNGLTCESNRTVRPPKMILEILEVPRGKRDMLFSRRKAGQGIRNDNNQPIDR